MADRRTQGFTLIEILIVVGIIGLLASVLITNLIGRAGQAKVDLTSTQIRQLEQALEMYKLDNGRYPTEEQGLAALVRAPSSDPVPRRYNPGGYVKRDSITDPWGVRYEYKKPGTHNAHSFDLYSVGPDGTQGGEGGASGITNWDEEPL